MSTDDAAFTRFYAHTIRQYIRTTPGRILVNNLLGMNPKPLPEAFYEQVEKEFQASDLVYQVPWDDILQHFEDDAVNSPAAD